MGDLKVNGLAVRWRNDFTNGDLTNPDPNLEKEPSDIVRKLQIFVENLVEHT